MLNKYWIMISKSLAHIDQKNAIQFVTFRTQGSVAYYLKKNNINCKVIVFFAYDQDDLTLALSLREYVIDTRVIMVLPDWEGETVKMGLSISPTLITNANGDFSDVVAVLEKISTISQ